MTLTGREVVGYIALYLASSLSAAAGVGGGAINVAIFYIIMGYSWHYSVVYSLSTLLGNYLFQILINWNRRHPITKNRPVIYWDVVLMLLPAELGGADLGVILGYILPDTLLLVFAIVVLFLTSILTFKKGMHYYRKESKEKLKENQRYRHGGNDNQIVDPLEIDTKSLISSRYPNDRNNQGVPFENGSFDARESQLKQYDDDAYSVPLIVPWIPISVVVGSWILYAIFYVSMNYVTKCTTSYYIFFSCIYPILIGEIIWGYLYLIRKQELQLRQASSQQNIPGSTTVDANEPLSEDESDLAEYLADALSERSKSISYRHPEYDERDYLLATTTVTTSNDIDSIHPIVKGDIQWGRSIFMPIIVVLLAFCIGITSALLGIGGGELMGPLLLRLKVLPDVSSSTIPVMSFLNTSSSIIHYMTIGTFPYLSSIIMFIIGALGGITGRSIATQLVRLLKRQSILVFFLVSILLLSVILFSYELSEEPDDWSFGSFC